MSSGRTYNITFGNVSVSAVQDLIAATATASMAFEVVGFGIGPCNTTVENVLINLKRLTATVSAGSGGGSATPSKDNTSDAAATATGRINDTVQATTSGSTVYLHRDALNEVNGFEWLFPERARPVAAPGEAIILELASAPGGARTMSGWMKIRELF